jgi:hypothetical protein
MDVIDVLGLDSLIAQIILAIGAAMFLGNGFAIYQHHKGRAPQGAHGEFRSGRAWWLLGVGAIITLWGVASLLTQ